MTEGRGYAIATNYLGDLMLDRHEYLAALGHFSRLEDGALKLKQPDLHAISLRGQAHALSCLGKPDEALSVAARALAMAEQCSDASSAVNTLQVIAEIHSRNPGREPQHHGESALAPSVPLRYLNEAMDIAASIPGYTISVHLLEAIAKEYAGIEDYGHAYEFAMKAKAAHERTRGQEATNRAVAMQIRAAENARAESEYLRQLVDAEAGRALSLKQSNDILEQLSVICQEITAHLHTDAIIKVLDRHVHNLLDTTCFAIYLMDEDGQGLTSVYDVEEDRTLPSSCIPLSDPQSYSARCVRERREIIISLQPDSENPNLIPGTLPTLSAMFAPLVVVDRALGLMTIQSPRQNAYSDREQLIFRTLCAYGAIALDNARAYRQVEETMEALNTAKAQLHAQKQEIENACRALEEASATDSLTGLRNRRFLVRNMEVDASAALRRQGDRDSRSDRKSGADDILICMVDVDHFKEVNDRFGHAAGDTVLMQLADRLRRIVRESDYLVRWGGEEFLVVLRNVDRSQAAGIAGGILAAVSSQEFDLGGGNRLPLTCSVGFASYPFLTGDPACLTWPQVLDLADKGLYEAKRGGRNAWVGVVGHRVSRAEGHFQMLMDNFDQTLRQGDITLITSFPERSSSLPDVTRH